MSPQALRDYEDSGEPVVLSSVAPDTVTRVSRPHTAASSPAGNRKEHKSVNDSSRYKPMNELSRLILSRKDELDLTWDDIADRGGFSSHTIVYALATKKEHRQTPRLETLERLAKALNLPLDVVKVAAIQAAGFTFEEVPTTLRASADLRIIAAAIGEMTDDDRAKLVRLAEAFASDSKRNATDDDAASP